VRGLNLRTFPVRDLNLDELHSLAGDSILNLLRRGADGSLRLSADRWQLAEVSAEAVIFHSVAADQADLQVLAVPLADIARVTWDRLPKQQTRSQLRFHLASGDLWTFSGALAEPD
jgi:hypothetical protein